MPSPRSRVEPTAARWLAETSPGAHRATRYRANFCQQIFRRYAYVVPESSGPRDHKTVNHGERTIYDSEWVRLALADIETPTGARFEHHVLYMKPVAIAVLVDDSDRVLMLRRQRWVTEQWGYELLGGLVEPGEEPAEAARREAEEESGWRPLGDPEPLVGFQPLPGMVNAPVDMFLWREFEKVGEPTDLEEAGELSWVALDRLPGLLAANQLLGAGTIIATLQVLAMRQGTTFTPEGD